VRWYVTLDGIEHVVDVAELPSGRLKLSGPSGAALPADTEVLAAPGSVSIRAGGRVLELVLDGKLPSVEVWGSGRHISASVESARSRAAASARSAGAGHGAGIALSPMPGKVIKVLVAEGDTVAAGAALCVVEAMKMENEIFAEHAGRVSRVHVRAGDAVEGGAPLVAIEADGA
jgi:biotin carboxyl carrier protein